MGGIVIFGIAAERLVFWTVVAAVVSAMLFVGVCIFLTERSRRNRG